MSGNNGNGTAAVADAPGTDLVKTQGQAPVRHAPVNHASA